MQRRLTKRMQATACMASVVSWTLPARRCLIRVVRRCYALTDMKLTRKPALVGLTVLLAALVALYGYRFARAERHRTFDRACGAGDIARVTLLLRLGADPNGVRDATYYSRYAWTVFETTPPLHIAAAGGHTEVVRLLLARGANPDRTAIEQMTAGDFARHEGHVEIARILHEAQSK